MAGAQTRSASLEAGTIAFELERFEVTDEQRIEVVGRWFGVRGRRFVRPTLSLDAGDGIRRALAELDHKPWAAEEGEPWIATFRLEAMAEAGRAELAVAPDIAVDLPAPDKPGRRRNGKRTKPTLITRTDPGRSDATGVREAGTLPASPAHAEQNPRAELQTARTEIARLRETRDAAYQRLAGEREALAAAQVELKQALASSSGADTDRRDEAAAEVERTRRERDAAIGERDETRAELRRILAERDAAIGERDAAASERDALRGQRDELNSGREAVRRERDTLARDRDALARERELLGRNREQLETQRETATREREALTRERETLAARRDALARELAALREARDDIASERDVVLREVDPRREGPTTPLTEPPRSRARRPQGLGRALAGHAAGDDPIDQSRRSTLRWLALAALAALALALVLAVRLSM